MPDAGQKTVLIVEDDVAFQQIILQALEKGGFMALGASDGQDGLAMALSKHPDLILLDILMPHDGITMLDELRRDEPYGKQVPIIFLTNFAPDTKRIIQAVETHEPVFYLIKADTTPALVVEKVQEALGSH